MEQFTVVCCKVTGHGQSVSVVVANREDWTYLFLDAEKGRPFVYDSEFKHLQDWCEENGLTYVEKTVTFNVDFER